ncbi:MAG: FkbM family methyltransferase [Oceanicaulis sp.]
MTNEPDSRTDAPNSMMETPDEAMNPTDGEGALQPDFSPGHGAYAPGFVAKIGLAVGRRLPTGRAGLRLAGAARPLALTGLRQGRSDVEALGLKLRLHPRDNLSEKRLFLTPQCFDPAELDAVRAAMGPGRTFLDIGANAGAYALVAAKAGGPKSRVIAVEPQAEMRRRLSFNAHQNGLGNIEITGVALADYEGEDVMRLVGGNLGRTLLSGESETSGEAVRVTTLPRLMEEMGVGRIDAMKIDVEGGEFAILSAFFKTVDPERWPDLMVLERADMGDRDAPDAAALARSKGYAVRQLTRMNVILSR